MDRVFFIVPKYLNKYIKRHAPLAIDSYKCTKSCNFGITFCATEYKKSLYCDYYYCMFAYHIHIMLSFVCMYITKMIYYVSISIRLVFLSSIAPIQGTNNDIVFKLMGFDLAHLAVVSPLVSPRVIFFFFF